jgi:hypothetical protein
MKRKSGLSATFSGKSSETLTPDFTIYDVPGAVLDARHLAFTLLKHPDAEVKDTVERIVVFLTRSIRAMGREDMAVLQVVEDKEEVA